MNAPINQGSQHSKGKEGTREIKKHLAHSAKIWSAFRAWMKGPEMTFEQWEKLERKYSPSSSHHAQIYFRERGL